MMTDIYAAFALPSSSPHLLGGRRSIPTLLLLLLVVPQLLAQEPLELFVRDDLVRVDLFTERPNLFEIVSLQTLVTSAGK
jgi:hypothetical protein